MDPKNSKKKKEDLQAILEQEVLQPGKKEERKSVDYTDIRKAQRCNSKDPKYGWHAYDNTFKFLYNMPIQYTKILKEINDVHNEFGYLTPIVFQEIAKKLNMPLAIVWDIIYTFRRKKILFLYKHNVVRLNHLLTGRHIIDMMLKRHPSVASHKGLGYKPKSAPLKSASKK